ncbi:MAG: inositol monophosphatase family protein [Deltaproteobacteria bacterium]
MIKNRIIRNQTNDPSAAFVEVFRVAALQVGCVSRHLQHEISLHRKSGDSDESTALTAVDLAAQQLILQLLHATMADLAVDAEEETSAVTLFPPEDGQRPLIIVDPIDGTLNYFRGSDDYAVMAALCIKEQYRAAVVYFPVPDTMYWTTGEGAYRQERKGGKQLCSTAGRPGNHLLVSSFVDPKLRRRLEEAGYTTELSHCSAVDALAPVSGRAAAAINSRLDRRAAIGFPITVAAGGTVLIGERTWQGEDPANRFDPKSKVVVAGSATLAEKLNTLLTS